MKKVLFSATLAAALIGMSGAALAQSQAMEEAYDANSEPLSQGTGVTASGEHGTASGHSDATNESMNAVEAETAGKTSIQDSQALDELNADGHSAAAGDAIESQ